MFESSGIFAEHKQGRAAIWKTEAHTNMIKKYVWQGQPAFYRLFAIKAVAFWSHDCLPLRWHYTHRDITPPAPSSCFKAIDTAPLQLFSAPASNFSLSPKSAWTAAKAANDSKLETDGNFFLALSQFSSCQGEVVENSI